MVVKNIDNINFEVAANSVEGKLNQVRVLLNTIKGSVPLNRELGIDPQIIDKPTTMIKVVLMADLQKQIRQFAKEFKLDDLELHVDENGKVIITIYIEVEGGENN